MAKPQSTKAPAFQFYPKEFLSSSKVISMTATERGVYITLLCMQWLDGSLPDDLPSLARLTGVNAKAFVRMWPHNLARCFTSKNGRLTNDRLERERKKQAEYRRRQTDNASRGWDSRRNAVAVPPHQSGNALLSAISDLRSAEREKPAPPAKTPIHDRSHREHALCGRVCLHASQFGEFVRRRNHDGADREIRQWAGTVVDAWTDGTHAKDEPGDSFDFWRGQYAERWPATPVAKPRDTGRTLSVHEHPYGSYRQTGTEGPK